MHFRKLQPGDIKEKLQTQLANWLTNHSHLHTELKEKKPRNSRSNLT